MHDAYSTKQGYKELLKDDAQLVGAGARCRAAHEQKHVPREAGRLQFLLRRLADRRARPAEVIYIYIYMTDIKNP